MSDHTLALLRLNIKGSVSHLAEEVGRVVDRWWLENRADLGA